MCVDYRSERRLSIAMSEGILRSGCTADKPSSASNGDLTVRLRMTMIWSSSCGAPEGILRVTNLLFSILGIQRWAESWCWRRCERVECIATVSSRERLPM